MPVGTKRLGLAVAALILAATCAFLLVALLMPADSVRDAVKAEIRAVTGLEPVVRGGVSVSLFPSGRVSLEDVALGDNRTGATALTAEHVLARLRFFPLLIGRIEIADILLVRPTITVVLDHDRSSNWSGHLEALARNLQLAPPPAASFSEIRIEDGTLILQDEANKSREKLSKVEFRACLACLHLAQLRCNRRICHGTISRSPRASALPISSPLCAATARELKVRLAGAPLNFAFDGYISHRPTLKMEGTLAADAGSLRDALRWTGQQAPPGAGSAALLSRPRRMLLRRPSDFPAHMLSSTAMLARAY
jgi:AsmA protein